MKITKPLRHVSLHSVSTDQAHEGQCHCDHYNCLAEKQMICERSLAELQS